MRTLEEVELHQRVIVKALHNHGSIRRRLLDLGIVVNTEIEPVLESASHHMRAYFVKGTLIALRTNETSLIEVGEMDRG